MTGDITQIDLPSERCRSHRSERNLRDIEGLPSCISTKDVVRHRWSGHRQSLRSTSVTSVVILAGSGPASLSSQRGQQVDFLRFDARAPRANPLVAVTTAGASYCGDSGQATEASGRACVSAVGEAVRAQHCLVGDGRMRRLNHRYRKKDRTTDVLAFDAGSRQSGVGTARRCGDLGTDSAAAGEEGGRTLSENWPGCWCGVASLRLRSRAGDAEARMKAREQRCYDPAAVPTLATVTGESECWNNEGGEGNVGWFNGSVASARRVGSFGNHWIESWAAPDRVLEELEPRCSRRPRCAGGRPIDDPCARACQRADAANPERCKNVLSRSLYVSGTGAGPSLEQLMEKGRNLLWC